MHRAIKAKCVPMLGARNFHRKSSKELDLAMCESGTARTSRWPKGHTSWRSRLGGGPFVFCTCAPRLFEGSMKYDPSHKPGIALAYPGDPGRMAKHDES